MAEDRGQRPGAGRPGRRAGSARLHEVRRRQGRRPPVAKGQKAPTDGRLKKQCKQEYDTLKGEVMQFLIQADVGPAGGRQAGHQGLRRRGQELVRGPEEGVVPEGQGVPGIPQDLGHERGGHPLPGQAGPAPAEAHPEGDQGREQGLRRGRAGVLREEQEAVRAARAPRPAGRSHEDGGQGQPGEERPRGRARTSRPWPRSTRSTRPRRPRAASCPAVAKGQQEKALDNAVFAAKKGELEGPVKTQFGWYVFEVTKITPASQQSLSRRPPRRSRTCSGPSASRRRWTTSSRTSARTTRADTACADDYKVAECKNGPEGPDRHRRGVGWRPAGPGRSPDAPQAPRHSAGTPQQAAAARAAAHQPVGVAR